MVDLGLDLGHDACGVIGHPAGFIVLLALVLHPGFAEQARVAQHTVGVDGRLGLRSAGALGRLGLQQFQLGVVGVGHLAALGAFGMVPRALDQQAATGVVVIELHLAVVARLDQAAGAVVVAVADRGAGAGDCGRVRVQKSDVTLSISQT